MYSNSHGVPSFSVSGTDKDEQFVMHNREESRADMNMDTAAMEQRILLKANAGGTALEMVTAATDTVVGVLVEPKLAGVTTFYCLTDCTVNRRKLNLAAMGITDADLDQLQISNTRIVYAEKIFSGAE